MVLSLRQGEVVDVAAEFEMKSRLNFEEGYSTSDAENQNERVS